MKEKAIDFLKSIRGTYCLVFFSNSTVFALCLILASFMDPCVGMAGFICTLITLTLSLLLGLNPALIKNGTYSFNSLLTGLALGAYFKFSGNFLVMLCIASALTLFMTVFLAYVSERNKLPFLSLPFIFTTWIILLNARSFENSFLIPKDAAGCSELWGVGFKELSYAIGHSLPDFFSVYFKAMGAVFFQTHLLAGIFISLGLLLYSRIAFVLSFVGFLTGLFYTRFIHGNLNDQEYALIAFNYILTALGLGGYFLIASRASFLLVIFIAPVLGLLSTSVYKLIGIFSLPLYSLPFSIVVILALSLLNNRYAIKYLNLVYFQQFSPEKNLYAFHTFTERFKKYTNISMHLPFFGEWTVSQGHNGKMTHKGDWRFALDFIVTDDQKRSFKFPGKSVTDFFCYGLPVLAAADGQVITIEDGIEDNEIGDANLLQNWGNTIVIKHADHLYSKLSHLKKGSFKVKQGDNVKKGDVLALCGNSGRSPEPHVHFQMQASEYVGAPTIDFPINCFVVKSQNDYQLKVYDIPKEGDVLVRPAVSPALKKAFHFIPGMKLNFDVNDREKNYTESWEVHADVFNNSYIQCKRTNSVIYFKNTGTLFYFTAFEGDTSSLLFYFYLGAYKVVLSQLENLQVNDKLPVEGIQKGILKVVQDLVAPFYFFVRPEFSSRVKQVTEEGIQKIKIVSDITTGEVLGRKINSEIELVESKIFKIRITENNTCLIATLKS